MATDGSAMRPAPSIRLPPYGAILKSTFKVYPIPMTPSSSGYLIYTSKSRAFKRGH